MSDKANLASNPFKPKGLNPAPKIRRMAGCVFLVLLMVLPGCGVRIVPLGYKENAQENYIPIRTDPKQQVVLNIADWSDSTKEQREALNRQFEADHPNVKINYTTLTQAQFNETVASGIRSGNAPDLFPLPSNTNLQIAVQEGWYLPLSLYLDQSFFDSLRPEAYQESVTMIDGTCYILPESREIPSVMMFYNKDILEECGVRLEQTPLSWDEFEQICTTITEKSGGRYYALAESGRQINRIDLELRALCNLNGARLGPADQVVLKDGKTQFDSPAVLETLAFYQRLAKNKAFHPDSAGLSAPEARKLFEQGRAAFIVQGSWCIPAWQKDAPQLNFDVTWLPAPNGKEEARFEAPFTKGWMGISAQSAHPDIAAQYLEALYSYEYQSNLMAPGGFVSIRKDLGADNIQNAQMKEYVRKADLQSEKLPNPISLYPGIQQVYALMEPVNPDFGTICAGILAGNQDYESELHTYNEKLFEALRRAVDASKSYSGISLEDFDEKRQG